MRKFLISALFLFSVLGVKAQLGCFIEGPEFIACPPAFESYFIGCQSGVIAQDWIVVDSFNARIIREDSLRADIEFYAPGVYTVIAFVISSSGVIDTVSMDVIVEGGIDEFIEIAGCYEEINGCLAVCTGSTLEFFVDGNSGQWIVNGDALVFPVGSGISVEWGAPGLAQVIYESTCGPQEICVNVLPDPEADFSITGYPDQDTISVCRHEILYLENETQNALSIEWNFGDGTTSTVSDPEKSYDTPGFYTITQSASSVCDCRDMKEVVIQVSEEPSPTLECINSVCPETRQLYTATTDGCNTYNWSISSNGTIISGGGLTDDFIEIIWHSGPDGIIELSVSDCNTIYCSSVARFRVPIITPDGPISGDPSVCPGELVTYSAPYFPGTTYAWSLSANGTIMGETSGSEITVLWDDVNAVTSATIEVSYDNCFLECGGQDDFAVRITPIIRLEGDRQVCQDGTAEISALAGFGSPMPVVTDWELRDASGNSIDAASGLSSYSFTFAVPPGVYYWTALNTSADYCNTVIDQRIVVTATPSAPDSILGETDICPGTPYGYTVEASGEYGTLWTVTDGAMTTEYRGGAIEYTFGFNPPYRVSAVHYDLQYKECTSDVLEIELQNGIQRPIEGPDTVCLQDIVDYSIPHVGGGQYEWRISPDNMGELIRTDNNEVRIFWTRTGDAELILEACGLTTSKQVHIPAPPEVDVLGDFEVCSADRAEVYTAFPDLIHRWRDEDGALISTLATARLGIGHYSLEVIDALGCSDRLVFEIEGFPSPEIALTSPDPLRICESIADGVPLVANTDGEDYMFTWFQDGIAVGSGPTYDATDFGVYHVEVINEYGCLSRSAEARIGTCCPIDSCLQDQIDTIDGVCELLYSDLTIEKTEISCSEKTYRVTDTDYVPGSGEWYIWSISELLIAGGVGDDFNYQYSSPGYYQVFLYSKEVGYPYPAAHCNHLQYFTDTIDLVSDFLGRDGCVGDSVQFKDRTTSLPSVDIVAWIWDFGDPASGAENNSTDQNPTHVYSSPGTYTVSLTAEASTGCLSVSTHEVTIASGPSLIVDYDMLSCEDIGTQFALSGAAYDISWDFGDPSSANDTASETPVLHTYDDPGVYTVTVAASDVYGCRNEESINVDIRENTLNGDILVTPDSVLCQGDTAILTASPGGTSWLWNTGATTENIAVSASDQFSVFITDDFNCSYSPPAQFIDVQSRPIVRIRGRRILGDGEYGEWKDSLSLCQNEPFELQAFSDVPVNLSWSNGRTDSILVFDNHILNTPAVGDNEISVSAVAVDNNCPAEMASFSIRIFAPPSAPSITRSSGSGCSFDENILEVLNPQSDLSYIWSDGQEGTSITVTLAGDYFVEAVNQNGCRSRSNSLRVRPSPPVDRLPGGCFDLCDPFLLCLPALEDIQSYEVFRDGIRVNLGFNWPSDYLIDEEGSYVFAVTSVNGCTAQSEPLNVNLYSGVGSITVSVFSDVDGDGAISALDTLVPGIDLILESPGFPSERTAVTDGDGSFGFVDMSAETYLARVDELQLDPAWRIVIDSLTGSIMDCGDSLSLSLLISDNCLVYGPDQSFTVCPDEQFSFQDSVWTGPGSYEYHTISTAGCDSVTRVELLLSDSLTIQLQAWLDQDANGSVSLIDSLLMGIDIIIENRGDGTTEVVTTDLFGESRYETDRSEYLIRLDPSTLPDGLVALIDSLVVMDTVCGLVELDLLLQKNCQDQTIVENYVLCPGDSLWVYGSQYRAGDKDTLLLSEPGSGCDTLVYLSVEGFPEIQITAEINNPCDSAASIELNVLGAGPFTYEWLESTSTGPNVSDLPPGRYMVTVTDVNGCQAYGEYDILPKGNLDFSIVGEHSIEEGEELQLEIQGDINEPGVELSWLPDTYLSCSACFNPIVRPLDSIVYVIEIVDSAGCRYDLQTRINLLASGAVYIPNVFSPNGDQINDLFRVRTADRDAHLEDFLVFDRRGHLVFQEKNVSVADMKGWDGTVKGNKYTSQVLVYAVTVVLSDGRKLKLVGDVTLVD